jgi:hypothetical protein
MGKNIEIWLDIQDFEGVYQISNYGRVKSLERLIIQKDGKTKLIKENILKGGIDKDGYIMVTLCHSNKQYTKYIHKLVAKHFIENVDNFIQVNHKNGNKKDNIYTNLEWCDASYNIRHALRTGLLIPLKGEEKCNHIITENDVIEIRKMWKHLNIKQREIANIYNITPKHVWKIIHNHIWKHIDI